MFRIAICDDESTICSQIEKIILGAHRIINEEIEIEIFGSGEELCEFMENRHLFDLIFMDIELKLINGIEVCRKIREEFKDESSKIIYISARDGYAMDLFESRPLNFLVKPLSAEIIIKNGYVTTNG